MQGSGYWWLNAKISLLGSGGIRIWTQNRQRAVQVCSEPSALSKFKPICSNGCWRLSCSTAKMPASHLTSRGPQMGSTVPLLQTLPCFQSDSLAAPLSFAIQCQLSPLPKQLYYCSEQIKTAGVTLTHLITKFAHITTPCFPMCLSKGFSSRQGDIRRSHIQRPASALAGPSQLNWHIPLLNGSYLVASISHLTASTETTHNQLQPIIPLLSWIENHSSCFLYFIMFILLFS